MRGNQHREWPICTITKTWAGVLFKPISPLSSEKEKTMKETPGNSDTRWEEDDSDELVELWKDETSLSAIAGRLDRTEKEIMTKAKELGLYK
jgi:hypothetical protein